MHIELFFDRLHARARSAPILHRFAWFNRIMLFLAFFPTGLIKVFGHPFASPKIGEPLYSFFSMLHSTGLWWRFIGLSQVIAAVLLITPRGHTLGAILFLPILLNILMITFSFNFNGTEVIAGGMLLANVYLICWDYHRCKSLMPWWTGRAGNALPDCRPALVEKVFMVLSVASGSITLDRLHWFNHWVSEETAHASQTIYIVSTVVMIFAFVFYSVRTKRTAGGAEPSNHSLDRPAAR